MSTVMTTKENHTRREQMDIKEHRTMNRYFVEKFGFGTNFLRRETAKKCVDLTNNLREKTTVVVRLFKGDTFFLIDRHEDGTDGLTEADRFWYEFPTYPISRFPLYPYLGEEQDGMYDLIEDGDLVDHIPANVVIEEAIEFLLNEPTTGFIEKFEEFEAKLYKWCTEVN